MPTECSDRTMPVPLCHVWIRPSLQGGPRFSRGRQRVELGPTADKASTSVGTLKGVRAEAAPKSCVGLEMRTFACCRLLRSDEATRIHEVAPPSGSGRRVEMCTENWSVRQASCPLDGCLPSCRLSWAGWPQHLGNHGKCAGRACSRDSLPSAFAMPIPLARPSECGAPDDKLVLPLLGTARTHGSLPATLIKAPQHASHRRRYHSPYRFPPRAQTGEPSELAPLPRRHARHDQRPRRRLSAGPEPSHIPLQQPAAESSQPLCRRVSQPHLRWRSHPATASRPRPRRHRRTAQLGEAEGRQPAPRSVPTGTHGPTARLCTQSQTSTRAHPCASYYRAHAHPQCMVWPLVALGTVAANLTVCPISTYLSPRELAYILAKARPQLLFTTVGAEGEVPCAKLCSSCSTLHRPTWVRSRRTKSELGPPSSLVTGTRPRPPVWRRATRSPSAVAASGPSTSRREWTTTAPTLTATAWHRHTTLATGPTSCCRPGKQGRRQHRQPRQACLHPRTHDARGQQRRIAFVLWSSGTTGQSKGVLISHRALVSNTLGIWDSNPHFSGPSRGSNGGGERWITLAPWYHVYG